jgi:hypothetical protein
MSEVCGCSQDAVLGEGTISPEALDWGPDPGPELASGHVQPDSIMKPANTTINSANRFIRLLPLLR